MPVAGGGLTGRTQRGRAALPGQGGRARITVRPGRGSSRGRTPFAVLVVALLSGGLFGLLMLNTALNEGSFELDRLERQSTELTDLRQTLQAQIDQQSGPDALERRVRELGMVPGGDLAFLETADGSVKGTPSEAKDSPPVKRSVEELWPQPSPSAQPAPPAVPPVAPSGDPVQIDPAPPAAPSTPAPPAGGTPR
ncbi:septum formation initiator family protein [Kitasatospora sp. CMC57]|uniref:Septum formation initiator family protein n=1 Tax=Kitasatospora sp. CMC57 TaxID=3231513 RepID=A0AB33K3X1_9ACTN